MFLEASKILNKPLAALEEQSKIGDICDILIDPEKGQVLGYLVKSGLFSGLKVLPFSDLASYDDEGMVAKSQENLVECESIERIAKSMKDNIKILQAPVRTENGQNLGKVTDFIIDTQLGTITKYMVEGLTDQRIIPSDQIVEITPAEILVKDEMQFSKEETAEVPA